MWDPDWGWGKIRRYSDLAGKEGPSSAESVELPSAQLPKTPLFPQPAGRGTWHRCTFQANSPGMPGLNQRTCGLSQPVQFGSREPHTATGHLKCVLSDLRPTVHIKHSGFPRARKDKGSARFLISNHHSNYILKRRYLHMWIKSKIQKKTHSIISLYFPPCGDEKLKLTHVVLTAVLLAVLVHNLI